jgi:hypothetical protein
MKAAVRPTKRLTLTFTKQALKKLWEAGVIKDSRAYESMLDKLIAAYMSATDTPVLEGRDRKELAAPFDMSVEGQHEGSQMRESR